jgi:hypothetical protein
MKLYNTILAIALAAGCYNPQFKNGIACDPTSACPSGLTCGADNKCHPPGFEVMIDAPTVTPIDAPTVTPIDATADAPGGLDVDAPPQIDAAIVGCTSNSDCATPPTPCTVAGTCNLTTHECAFPAKDCSSLNDQCNQGICEAATGNCVKSPANSGFACGPNTVCDAFGPCGGFDPGNQCDSTGVKSRTCTVFSCQSGACTGTPHVENQDCIVSTNGNPCGSQVPVITNCSNCNYGSVCGETAPPRTCTCTTPVCMNDSCSGSVQRSCMQDCPVRNTDGTNCSPCFNQTQLLCGGGSCSVSQDC